MSAPKPEEGLKKRSLILITERGHKNPTPAPKGRSGQEETGKPSDNQSPESHRLGETVGAKGLLDQLPQSDVGPNTSHTKVRKVVNYWPC